MKCFECGWPAQADHHVVPRARGGTKTVPLCWDCHSKAHEMTLPALREAKPRGRIGGTRVDPYEAMRLHRMGYGIAEIAETLGVTPPTVSRYLKRVRDAHMKAAR